MNCHNNFINTIVQQSTRLHVNTKHHLYINNGQNTLQTSPCQGSQEGYQRKEEEIQEARRVLLYLHLQVLKQVHPDTGISKKGMSIMNSFINNIFERIAGEAGKLSTCNKKATLCSARSRRLWGSCFPASLQSTLCLRVPRLLPSSLLLKLNWCAACFDAITTGFSKIRPSIKDHTVTFCIVYSLSLLSPTY